MKAQELRKLIREEVRKVLSEQSLNEDFKSPILRRLLSFGQRTGWKPNTIAKAFYNMSKVALDQVEDSSITKMTPEQAYKTLKKTNPNAIVFYISEKGGTNPYAKDSYYAKIKPGTLLAVASGDNKFYSISTSSLVSKMNIASGDNLGVPKTGSGYGSTGLYNVKRIAEVADTAYVIDLSELKNAGLGTSEKIKLRTTQKAGATAFMTADQFKKDNLNRYRQILANRAAGQGTEAISKSVQEVILKISADIAKAVGSRTTGKYDAIVVGTDSRGREVTASDAAYFLRSILDTFERYIRDSRYADENSYYAQQVKTYALELKSKIAQAENMNYK